MLSKMREPVNGLTHLCGAIAAFFGMLAMFIIAWGVSAKVISVLVYSLGLIAMFLASAIYHIAMVKPPVLQTLRKIDHSAIFLLIAGTYTPFCVLAFTGFWHWGLLILIWVIAAIGIAGQCNGMALYRRSVIYTRSSYICHQDPGFRAGQIWLPRSLAHFCPSWRLGAFYCSYITAGFASRRLNCAHMKKTVVLAKRHVRTNVNSVNHRLR